MAAGSENAIERMFTIVEFLSTRPHGAQLKDIALQTELNKATTHRILSTLIKSNYAVQDAISGKYLLTPKFFEIGSRAISGINLLNLARPYLEHLSDYTEEAVHMAIPDGAEILYIYRELSSNNVVRMASCVGKRGPMYCTGLGKAILAYLPEDKAKEIWCTSNIIEYTQTTITSFVQLQAEMKLIRENRYAVDNEEHEIGVKCVAATILDASETPVAAISVAAHPSRLDEKRVKDIGNTIVKVASDISAILGYQS